MIFFSETFSKYRQEIKVIMGNFSKTYFRVVFALICFSIGAFWSLKIENTWSQVYSPFTNSYSHSSLRSNKPPKIVIGLVSCRKGNDIASNVEVTVLIKSVLISANLYGVKEIDFHIFLEFMEDSQFFETTLEKFGYPNSYTSVTLYFHSAVDLVPEKFKKQMIYKPRLRCTFARLYFPHAMMDVDSIIYLDTDFIITGNIVELWNNFYKMDKHQLVGVAPNNMPEKLKVKYKVTNCFGDRSPFVRPGGLNAGLLLMNLTKMREYGWEDKISRLYTDYVKMTTVEDQVILNILVYYDSGLLYRIPCHFNVRCSPCNNALLCEDVQSDPYGIQCIHGAYNQFEPNGRFYYIYKQFLEFDITKDDVVNDLMIPIVNAKEPRSKKGDQKCDPTVNQYLFTNILNKNISFKPLSIIQTS